MKLNKFFLILLSLLSLISVSFGIQIPYTYINSPVVQGTYPDSGNELNDNVICFDYTNSSCVYMLLDTDITVYSQLTDLSKRVKGYSFYYGGVSTGAYAPGGFTLYGSNDNINWVSTNSYSIPSGNIQHNFNFPNELKYEYWKLVVHFDSVRRWNAIREFDFIQGIEAWTPIIQSQINITNITLVNNSYFNINNISMNISLENISTNTNINSSYSLDNNPYIQFSTNQLNPTLNLINLTEGNHNLQFYFENNETNTTSDIYYFTIDTIEPTINNNIKQEYNNYTINLNSSCDDPNLLYCNITIENQTYSLNISNITLQHNGNISYIIQAKDLAGNIATSSGLTLINPYQYFYFNDSQNNYIHNFTINNKTYNDYFSEKIYDLGLGNHIYYFDKIGYNKTSFQISLNTTSKLNISFLMPGARIFIKVYDQISKNLINTTNLSLDLIGTSNFKTSTNSGIYNISTLILPGNYQAFVAGLNFISNQISFFFDGKSIINKNFYMLPLNSSLTGYIKITTYQSDGSFANGLTITANEWDSVSNSYINTYQTKSDSNGQAIVPIILQNKLYRFCADYPNGQNCFPKDGTGQLISLAQNGQNFPILPQNNFQTMDFSIDNVQLNINNHTLTNSTNTTYNYFIDYSWKSNNGLDIILCSKLEKDYNYSTTSVIDTCANQSSSGSYVNNFVLNNSYSYIFSIYSKDNSGVIQNLYSENILGNDNFVNYLEKYNLKFILEILIVALMIGATIWLKSPFLIVGDIILAFFITWKYILPQQLSITTLGAIIILGGFTLWGLSRK